MHNVSLTRRRLITSLTALGLLTLVPVTRTGAAAEVRTAALVAPASGLGNWKNRGHKTNVEWTVAEIGGYPAIRVESKGAIGVLQHAMAAPVEIRAGSVLRWEWQVDKLATRADLTTAESDDAPAALALAFGKVSAFRKAPPMLIYVWAGAANPVGEVLDCLHHPESMRFVVVQSGLGQAGRWLVQERDVYADYVRAFGVAPVAPVHSVALWSDTDQTGQQAVAWFGKADIRGI